MFERFSDRARKVMHMANQEAQKRGHEYVGTEHVLLGIAKEGSGVACSILRNLNIDYCTIKLEVEKLVEDGPMINPPITGKLPQTPRAKQILQHAMEEARNLGHGYVGTEHLLLGTLKEKEGIACHVLENLNIDLEQIRKEIVNLLGEATEEEKERNIKMPWILIDKDKAKKSCSQEDVLIRTTLHTENALRRIKPLLQQIVDILTEEGL